MDSINENQKRIEWIDALKGFLMFCVTLGHCNIWWPIEQYIYSFHMFLFFFISGFLFSVKQSTKRILAKCCLRLLLPFVAWNVLSAMIGFLQSKDLMNLIEELFVIKGNLTWNPPIWFLLVLFITEVLFILLKLYKRTWISIATIIICLVLWVLVGSKWLLWKLNLVPMAMAFFLFGYLFKNAVAIFKRWHTIIPLGFGSVVFSMLNIRIVYTYGHFGNYIYCILAAFCGVLFFVGLFSRVELISRLSFLKNWGKNSLIIMAMQYIVFRCVSIVSLNFLNSDLMKWQNSVFSLVLSLFTILVITLFVAIFKKLANRIKFLGTIGKAFGINY